jgi:cytochrome c-type biogenesis protein CcmH
MKAFLLVLVALVLATPASAGEARPTLAELEAEIICPTCQTTLDQSDAPIARRMKTFIAARIAAGDTKSEIKQRLVDQFGTGVLASPPKKGFNLLVWVLPPVGLVGGAAVLGALAWRWSRRPDETPSDSPKDVLEPLDPELERRLDDELGRFE